MLLLGYSLVGFLWGRDVLFCFSWLGIVVTIEVFVVDKEHNVR